MKPYFWLKKTVYLVVFIYLSLAFFMVMPMEQHAMTHGQSPDHAKEHGNLICAWMCTASSHVHSIAMAREQRFTPVFEIRIFAIQPYFQNKPLQALSIRPPPSDLV